LISRKDYNSLDHRIKVQDKVLAISLKLHQCITNSSTQACIMRNQMDRFWKKKLWNKGKKVRRPL